MAVASLHLDYGLASGTLGAETFHGVVDGLDTITFRQGDYGYLDVLYAECPAALLAVEMDVAVLDPADGGLAAAYLVFCGSAAVLESRTLRVRNIVDLSMVSNSVSNSVMDTG